jgi:hypothetical protein
MISGDNDGAVITRCSGGLARYKQNCLEKILPTHIIGEYKAGFRE